MKYDSEGNKIWGSYYNGNKEVKRSAIWLKNEHLYLTGITTSYEGIATPGTYIPEWNDTTTYHLPRPFVQKLNKDTGYPIWGTYLRDESMNGTDVDSGLNFEKAVTVNANGYFFNHQIDTLKIISPSGQLVSANYSPLNISHLYGMKADQSGNIYIFGATENNNSIGTPGSYRSTKTFEKQWYLVKYNQIGEKQWGTYLWEPITHNTHNPMAFTAGKSDIFIATTTIETGLATSEAYQEEKTGDKDVIFLKINGIDGSLRWLSYYGGEGDEKGVWGIHVDEKENLYLNVVKSDSPSAEILTDNALFTAPVNNYGSFIVKFMHEKNLSMITAKEESFLLYPNPAQDRITVQGKTAFSVNTQISIYDLLGKKIKSYRGENTFTQNLDVSKLSSGIYFLCIHQNGRRQFLRFIKE